MTESATKAKVSTILFAYGVSFKNAEATEKIMEAVREEK